MNTRIERSPFRDREAAQEGKPAVAKDAAKPRVAISEVIELKAKVDAVDQAKRLVTFANPDGEIVVVKAGPAVKNLDQVKAGHELVIKFFDSIALFVHKGKETPSASEVAAVAVAEKGQEPGAVVIDSTDYKALADIKKGDELIIRHTEALAVSIEKSK